MAHNFVGDEPHVAQEAGGRPDAPGATTDAHLEQERLMYEQTSSPLLVRSSFLLCRRLGYPVPEWVLSAYEQEAERLHDVGDRSPGMARLTRKIPYASWHEEVLTAIGFDEPTGGGASDPFVKLQREFDDLHLAVRMRVLIDGEHRKPSPAAVLVASCCGVGKTMIKNAWRKFQSVAKFGELREQQAQIKIWDAQNLSYQEDALVLEQTGDAIVERGGRSIFRSSNLPVDPTFGPFGRPAAATSIRPPGGRSRAGNKKPSHK